jgi:hypothetical protein
LEKKRRAWDDDPHFGPMQVVVGLENLILFSCSDESKFTRVQHRLALCGKDIFDFQLFLVDRGKNADYGLAPSILFTFNF